MRLTGSAAGVVVIGTSWLMIFGGLTYEETGAALDLSPGAVHREMKLAKAWLHRELTPGQ
jgi:DNA-directed RNA polymerase specialized sigma24 family protein